MSNNSLVLVSYRLCPYVQRAAIVLLEKQMPFERRDVDLGNKPDWFKRVSPLGKTPVLLVDGEPIFESAVICEYLDDTCLPRLHPDDALHRARHRAYMAFGSAILDSIAAFYNAASDEALHQHAVAIRERFSQMEALLVDGPFFMGARFSMVDAMFAPVFRYFDAFEHIDGFGAFFFERMPKVQAWRHQLAQRASVQQAVSPDYPMWLHAFLCDRASALSRRMG